MASILGFAQNLRMDDKIGGMIDDYRRQQLLQQENERRNRLDAATAESQGLQNQQARMSLAALGRKQAEEEAARQAVMTKTTPGMVPNPAYRSLADLRNIATSGPPQEYITPEFEQGMTDQKGLEYPGAAFDENTFQQEPEMIQRQVPSASQALYEHFKETGNIEKADEIYQGALKTARDLTEQFGPEAGSQYFYNVTGEKYTARPQLTQADLIALRGEQQASADERRNAAADARLEKTLTAQAERDERNRAAADARTERLAASKGGQPAASLGKPPAGYRWNTDGNLEAIPGGPAAAKEAVTREGKEKAIAAYDNSSAVIDRLLAHPGRKTATGLSSKLDPRNYTPGTDAYDFGRELESFDAVLFLSNIEKMKGMGALSNAEGAKVSAAAGAIKPGMSEKAFETNLKIIKTELQKAKNRIDAGLTPQPTPAPAATGGPKPGAVEGGYRFKGGRPDDPKNWVKVGK